MLKPKNQNRFDILQIATLCLDDSFALLAFSQLASPGMLFQQF
jgi:hypothetical protein